MHELKAKEKKNSISVSRTADRRNESLSKQFHLIWRKLRILHWHKNSQDMYGQSLTHLKGKSCDGLCKVTKRNSVF